MPLLLVSAANNQPQTFINAFTPDDIPINWYMQPVVFEQAHYSKIEKEYAENASVYVHLGISDLEQDVFTIFNPYDFNFLALKDKEIRLDGLNMTITQLVHSFIYRKPPIPDNYNRDEYPRHKFALTSPPTVIFLFVKELTDDISTIITRSMGVDVFGRSNRKVYVVAIPIIIDLSKDGLSKTNALENALYKILQLIKINATIHKVLSAFKGSKHFVQQIQEDSGNDEQDLKFSLNSALKISLTPKSRAKTENKDVNSPKRNIYPYSKHKVYCTVYSPDKVLKGNELLIQVFSHKKNQNSLVDYLAREADGDATRRVSTMLDNNILIGSKIEFQLVLPGFDIDNPILFITWTGDLKTVQFSALAPKSVNGDFIGKIIVLQDSIPIGCLKFKITVVTDISSTKPGDKKSSPMKRFEMAFISYASQDRPEVLKRVQMLNLVNLNFFQDLLILEPGDQWELKIYDYISRSDVLFLFWSKAASESFWVKKEILYALEVKQINDDNLPEIIPVIIEGPPPATPPSELSFLHFNDKMIYFI